MRDHPKRVMHLARRGLQLGVQSKRKSSRKLLNQTLWALATSASTFQPQQRDKPLQSYSNKCRRSSKDRNKASHRRILHSILLSIRTNLLKRRRRKPVVSVST
jgi:hypothetical protein